MAAFCEDLKIIILGEQNPCKRLSRTRNQRFSNSQVELSQESQKKA